MDENCSVHDALYLATLGHEVVEHAKHLGWDHFQTGMDSMAMQVLEQIYAILEDDRLNDSECFMKIDRIVHTFYQYLDLESQRHIECE